MGFFHFFRFFPFFLFFDGLRAAAIWMSHDHWWLIGGHGRSAHIAKIWHRRLWFEIYGNLEVGYHFRRSAHVGELGSGIQRFWCGNLMVHFILFSAISPSMMTCVLQHINKYIVKKHCQISTQARGPAWISLSLGARQEWTRPQEIERSRQGHAVSVHTYSFVKLIL